MGWFKAISLKLSCMACLNSSIIDIAVTSPYDTTFVLAVFLKSSEMIKKNFYQLKNILHVINSYIFSFIRGGRFLPLI